MEIKPFGVCTVSEEGSRVSFFCYSQGVSHLIVVVAQQSLALRSVEISKNDSLDAKVEK